MNIRAIRQTSETHLPWKAPIYMARLARTISSDRFRHFLRKYGPILLSPGTHTKRPTTVLVSKLYTFRPQNEEQCFFVVLYSINFLTLAEYRYVNDYYHGVYSFTVEYLGQQRSFWIFRFLWARQKNVLTARQLNIT